MANLKTAPLLSANGDYDLAPMVPGREYLLTMKGTWGGGTITAKFDNGASAAFVAVDGGSWDGSGATEARLVAPSGTLRLTLAGATTPSLQITVIPRA